MLKIYGVFATFSAIMNARGFSGSFAPEPFQPLDDATRRRVLNLPIIQQLLAECPAPHRVDAAKHPSRSASRRLTAVRFTTPPDGKADGKADGKSNGKSKVVRRL